MDPTDASPRPFSVTGHDAPALGLIVLQSDETLEREAHALLPDAADLYVTRIPSAQDVTPASLAAMETHLPAAASLLPPGRPFAALGYGCTSGAAQIGADRVAALLRGSVQTAAVTSPLGGLVALCRAMGVTRLGLVSPYIAAVSDNLRRTLASSGIGTPAFAGFGEARERVVARIDTNSVVEAASGLGGGVEAIFLSCTNLRSLEAIARIRDRTGLPVLSSNTALCWHLCHLAGLAVPQHPAMDGLPASATGRRQVAQDTHVV